MPYRFIDVSLWYENGVKDFRPDIVLTETHEQAREAYEHKMSADKRHSDRGRCAWPWMASVVEVKYESEPGFKFELEGGLLNKTEKGNDARAQFAKYVTEVMIRQHRTHVFAIYICKTKARMFRWDRNGCVATEPIDLLKEDAVFLNLIYRLVRLNKKALGYDDSVMPADDDELAQLLDYETDNVWLKQYHAHMIANSIEYPIHKVCPRELMHHKIAHVSRRLLRTTYRSPERRPVLVPRVRRSISSAARYRAIPHRLVVARGVTLPSALRISSFTS